MCNVFISRHVSLFFELSCCCTFSQIFAQIMPTQRTMAHLVGSMVLIFLELQLKDCHTQKHFLGFFTQPKNHWETEYTNGQRPDQIKNRTWTHHLQDCPGNHSVIYCHQPREPACWKSHVGSQTSVSSNNNAGSQTITPVTMDPNDQDLTRSCQLPKCCPCFQHKANRRKSDTHPPPTQGVPLLVSLPTAAPGDSLHQGPRNCPLFIIKHPHSSVCL